jgi:hypothetical protein
MVTESYYEAALSDSFEQPNVSSGILVFWGSRVRSEIPQMALSPAFRSGQRGSGAPAKRDRSTVM